MLTTTPHYYINTLREYCDITRDRWGDVTLIGGRYNILDQVSLHCVVHTKIISNYIYRKSLCQLVWSSLMYTVCHVLVLRWFYTITLIFMEWGLCIVKEQQQQHHQQPVLWNSKLQNVLDTIMRHLNFYTSS